MYLALSRVSMKNYFKIILTVNSVYTQHIKYKADFLRNNVNKIPNVYTKKIAYEEILCITSNCLFVCLLLLILINNTYYEHQPLHMATCE